MRSVILVCLLFAPGQLQTINVRENSNLVITAKKSPDPGNNKMVQLTIKLPAGAELTGLEGGYTVIYPNNVVVNAPQTTQLQILSNQAMLPPCDPDWTYFGKASSCYKLVSNSTKGFDAAEQLCEEQGSGSHLVSITSMDEFNFVRSILNENLGFGYPGWIGLHTNKYCALEWTDGTAETYFQELKTCFPNPALDCSIEICSVSSEPGSQCWGGYFGYSQCDHSHAVICKRPQYGAPSEVDGCLTENGGCSQKCVSLSGSFECQCDQGFYLASDGKTCQDVDECQQSNGGCSQICVNLPKSHECQCQSGFSLASDGRTCEDVDECLSDRGGCSQLCINLPGTFECQCDTGDYLESDGKTCQDVNECVRENGGCSQICVNLPGNFYCKCDPGYSLAADWETCEDVDECLTNKGGCSQVCVNLPGTFECQCESGYSLASDGTTCEDVDECLTNKGGCSQDCVNLPGTFECQCESGYSLASDGTTCEDVDECLTNKGGCSQECVNLPGTFECQCESGYSLANDGTTCEEDAPCEEGWVYYEEANMCYKYIDYIKTWNDASAYCATMSAALVQLRTDELRSYLFDALPNYTGGYVGLHAGSTCEAEWVDGTSFEPTGNMTICPYVPVTCGSCAKIYRYTNTDCAFMFTSCDNENGFMCEKTSAF